MNARLLFFSLLALNIVLFVGSPLLAFIADSGAAMAKYIPRISPNGMMTLTALLFEAALAVLNLLVARHLWSTAHAIEGLNTELAVYSGMAGLMLLYNISMFSLMVFFWTGND
jgi:hypothetical protein